MKISRRQALWGGAAVGAAGIGALAATVIGPGSEVLPGQSRARPLRTGRQPPREADVVIIGGGNIGAASAYYLARAGLSVVLCEKGTIAGEASGRSVGHILSVGAEKEKLPIINRAKELWTGINAELGIETGFRPYGLITEIKDEEERSFMEKWLHDMRDLVPHARILERAEIAKLAPVKKQWFGAIYDPTEGSAEPPLVAPAFAEAAQRLGAKIVAPCAVRGVEMTGGRISGVVTEHGPIKCSTVVLASGSWTEKFLHNMDLRFPLGNVFQWCSSFYGVSGPAVNGIFSNTTWRRQYDGGFTTSLRDVNAPITPSSLRYLKEMMEALHIGRPGWAIRPRLGGYFFEELVTPSRWKLDEVSPFEKRRILEPELDQNYIAEAQRQMREDVIGFAGLKVREAWGGVISALPDSMPVLGELPGYPGMVMAVAMPEGLTTAPAVGELVAEMVQGKRPRYDLSPFHFSRLAN